jgi:hypothetical protein
MKCLRHYFHIMPLEVTRCLILPDLEVYYDFVPVSQLLGSFTANMYVLYMHF